MLTCSSRRRSTFNTSVIPSPTIRSIRTRQHGERAAAKAASLVPIEAALPQIGRSAKSEGRHSWRKSGRRHRSLSASPTQPAHRCDVPLTLLTTCRTKLEESSSEPGLPPRFNRAGDVRADYARAANGNAPDPAGDLDRKPHDLPLSEAAAKAITALREVKEESDGFARARDLQGIEMAKQKGAGAINGAGIQHPDTSGAAQSSPETPDSQPAAAEEGFCSTCFVPLNPDPRPEQLFIWLHAMRCKFPHLLSYRSPADLHSGRGTDTTIEWDWSSALPFWAEETYEVPLSSILS